MMIGDIVGYVDSRKMTHSEFQQEQLVLVAAGWELRSSAMGHDKPCACGSKHVVYMTYERSEDMKDFNLCLECGSVVEQVPVFEQVEQPVEAAAQVEQVEAAEWLRSSVPVAQTDDELLGSFSVALDNLKQSALYGSLAAAVRDVFMSELYKVNQADPNWPKGKV